MAQERLSYLEHVGRGSAGEVERLAHVQLGVVVRHVAVNHHRLGRSLLTNQQHRFVLLSHRLNEERCAHIVDVGHENRRVLGRAVGRVVILLDARAPVLPLA